MKLIVISSPDHFPGELQLINQLFGAGMESFHLRKPQWETSEFDGLLTRLAPEFYSRIVIHDHFQLAEKYQLGGIHFTGKTKPEMKEWLSFQGSKSISCHSMEEVESLDDQINYSFLSPVFPSISKVGYKSKFDFQQLSSFLKKKRQTQIIALGGITAEKIAECFHLGFDGAAVLGAIWQKDFSAERIRNRFTKILETCQNTVLR